jgi:hypothetical protein
MMTPVSDDSHKPETLFLLLTEYQRLVSLTILEQVNLTAGVLICLIRVILLSFKSSLLL